MAEKMTDLLIPFNSQETALRIAREIARRCRVRGIMLCDGSNLNGRKIDLRSVEEQARDTPSSPSLPESPIDG
jgi:hypothetical protein